MNKIISYISFLLFIMAVSGCTDDRLWNDQIIGEGESDITATLSFRAFEPALQGSRAAGDILDGLTRVTILAYSAESQELIASKVYSGTDLKTETNTQEPSDGVGVSKPVSTLKASLGDLKLPYGKYYIYAVGNAEIDTESEEVKTVAGLKEIRFPWNGEKIEANNQMFGWFAEQQANLIKFNGTRGDSDNPAENWNDRFNAPVVIINKKTTTLNAWLVRLASKVTVAFDGSNLKPNVKIFIKSVEIKDIPDGCYLGKTNSVSSDAEFSETEQISYKYDRTKFPDGPSLSDYEITTYPNFISDGHPHLDVNEGDPDTHDHEAEAFFFFENNQGLGKDKRQDHDADGVMDAPDGNEKGKYGWKDEKPYGTYIEVKAYYISNNEENQSQGEIIYRFMLGKNTTDNYEALRNYHYKLTLMFNGWANEPDWHIVYEEEKYDIMAPNPHYISYLYNRKMMLPVEITTGQQTIKKIEAKIISNGWAPINAEEYAMTAPTGDGPGNQPGPAQYGEYFLYLGAADKPEDFQWNGFLSVRNVGTLTNVMGTIQPGGYVQATIRANEAHWKSHHLEDTTYLDLTPTPEMTIREAQDEGKLHVLIDTDDNNNHVYKINMPLWTRAKNLISQTGYTGNNPYHAYRRKAKVKLTVTLSDGSTLTTGLDAATGTNDGEDIVIQQVERIVNPTGIYRSGVTHSQPFHVVLQTQKEEESTEFIPLLSDGPWRAYVFRDTKRDINHPSDEAWDDSQGTIRLEGAAGTTEGTITINDNFNHTRTYQTIEGKTGSKIDFTVVFNQTSTDNNHAIIRVEYMNYSCFHLIFVRQGYGPDNLIEGGPKWLAANQVTADKAGESPLDEGSLFKFGNSAEPIASSNNVNSKPEWVKIKPNDFEGNEAGDLTIAGDESTKKWGEIASYPTNGNNRKNFTEMKVATQADWLTLYSDGKDATKYMEQGFGVCYGDESTECATTIAEAYGYMENNKKGGMRGCFAYNYATGKNIFFPIGNSGYGHRKNSVTGPNGALAGLLRYNCNPRWGYFNAENKNSDRPTYPEGVYGAPLFLDVFRRPGAIYWYKELGKYYPENGETGAVYDPRIGWDINYYTLDFTEIKTGDLEYGADAVFVRCVE